MAVRISSTNTASIVTNCPPPQKQPSCAARRASINAITTITKGETKHINKAVKLAAITAALLLAASVAAIPSSSADTAKIAGEWNLTVESPNGPATPTATIKQDGEKLTGTYKGRFGESPLTG